MTAMGQVIEFSRQEVSISAGHAESMPTSEHFFTGKKRAQKSAVTPTIRGLNQIKLLVSCRLLWSDPDLLDREHLDVRLAALKMLRDAMHGPWPL